MTSCCLCASRFMTFTLFCCGNSDCFAATLSCLLFFMPCTFFSFCIFMPISALTLFSCFLFVFHIFFMTVWATNNFCHDRPISCFSTGDMHQPGMLSATNFNSLLLFCCPLRTWLQLNHQHLFVPGDKPVVIHFPTHFQSILVLLVNFWAHALNHAASGCSAGKMFASDPDGLGYPALLQISSFFYCTAISECSEPTCLLSS